MNNWIQIKILKRVKDGSLSIDEGMTYVLKFGLLGVISKEEEMSLMSMLEGMLQEE